MRIAPIQPIATTRNPPQRKAFVALHFDRHTVVTDAGEHIPVASRDSAFELCNQINGVTV